MTTLVRRVALSVPRVRPFLRKSDQGAALYVGIHCLLPRRNNRARILQSTRFRGNARFSRGLLKQDLYRQPVVHLFPTPTCGGRVFVNVHTVPLVHHWQFSPIGKRPQP